ncbi:hypothetical protein CC79DRAFT_1396062 [Sarocladium strictum]
MFLQPLTRETANPNAATAAASAFMRRDTQSPSLSSAAAAAALRARPTTPTNVAEVQSKRVTRRSASMSSTAGRGRGAPRPELRRAPSNSSMTERTFRTPSPSPGPSPALRREEVPPVPSLPQGDQFRGRTASHKKSTSLSTQPLRTASQKMKDGSGSWFGAATTHDPSNVRTSDAVLHQTEPFDDRSGSISPSVNFSYPRGMLESPTGSQRASSIMSEHTLVYDANSRRMVPQGELAARQHAVNERQFAIQAASEKPVKKKKQEMSRSGSHLAKGTVGRTKLVQVNPQSATKPLPAPEPIPAATAAMQTITAAKPEHEPVVETTTPQHDHDHLEDEEEPVQPEKIAVDELEIQHHQGMAISEAESGAHEQPTAEANDDIQRQRQATLNTLEQPREEPSPIPVTPVPVSVKSSRLVSPAPRQRESVSVSPAPFDSRTRDSIRRSRVHSESPARTARFATASDQLVVKHEPPPRSLSPRKSALKHASPRALSPSDDSSEASGPRSVLLKDDSVSRKKSARVSFNDKDTVVVGEAAEPSVPGSPVIPSPQVKKSWTSLIGRHKKDTISLDEDETMTPRPALPAFGSVREKKTRDVDERPLVRPADRTWSPSATASSAIGTAISPETAEDDEPELGSSNDHAVGAILAQDSASRNEANTSKYREPLPPVVTSMEHSGYISNSPMSTDDENEPDVTQGTARSTQELTQASEDITPETTQELESTSQPMAAELATSPTSNGTMSEGKTSMDSEYADFRDASSEPHREDLPIISVSAATPTAKDEEDSPRKQYFGIPGGFPEDDTSESSPRSSVVSPQESPAVLPLAKGSKPAPITPIKANEVEPSTPSPQMDKIQEEKESTSEDEVFSDAYEDPSDMEGDGFLSLDAILTTPVKSKMSQKLFEQSIAQQKKSKAEPIPAAAALSAEAASPKTADEWEQAKSYWKSLTADKRRQLELEAMEEAGEEADFEGTQKPKKAKKRKSLDKDALETQRHPERTYQIQPGTKWTQQEQAQRSDQAAAKQNSGLKKSLRGDAQVPETNQHQGGSMRRSLRSGEPASLNTTRQTMSQEAAAANSGGGLSMRKSMRSNEDGATTRQNGQAGRPVSYNPASTTNHARLHKRTQSHDESQHVSGGAASSVGMVSTLRRRGSDSSESSFRRARPGTANAGASGGMAFRSTMRGSMREAQRPAAAEQMNRSSRFSLRSLSPTPFRRGSTTSPPPPSIGNRMRPSLRSGDSSDGSTSRLRLFGRSNGKKPVKTSKASRFGDSSDEEDPRPAFSSRFADSSDEDDDGPPTRPVSRGLSRTMRNSQPAPRAPPVPRAPVRSDSPDLPDSDDELTQPKRGSAAAPTKQVGSLHRSGSGRGSLAAPAATASNPATPGAIPPVRPSHSRRGSFMSSILRRKKDPGSKISRDVGESAARRDTALERSTEQLVVMRSNSGGRLQKKGPNWPFPEDEDANDRRPATANASMTSPVPVGRPGVLQRRTMSSQIGVTGFDGASPDSPATPQKKKKFGALRKMFGIHN